MRRAAACLLWLIGGIATPVLAAQGNSVHSLQAHYTWENVRASGTSILKCPRRTLPVGLQYKKGRVVDRVIFFCAEPAFDSAAGYFRTRRDRGETVFVGGAGGETPHEMWCPDGMVIAGIHGVNYDWREPWMLATVGIDCGRLGRRNDRWIVPEHQFGSQGTSHARGLRTTLYAQEDMDNYNSGGFVTFYNDARKKTFSHYCPRTPLEGLEVATIDWPLFAGGTTKVVLGFRWTCF